MSTAVFFHNLTELNWKPWTLACLTAASAATYTISSGGAQKTAWATHGITASLSSRGMQAETQGRYRQARQDFDLALLKARASGNNEELISALMNSARIDSDFEEDNLATTLAAEALSLCKKLYGERNERTAEAMTVLASVTSDTEKAIALYKKALSIFKQIYGEQDVHVAGLLMELSYCYDSAGRMAQAISACKASMQIYEHADATDNRDYAKALIEYATIADLDAQTKTFKLNQAHSIQAKVLGINHPALCTTLNLLAADATSFAQKESYLKRAIEIDEEVFGSNSVQAAQQIAALADACQSVGKTSQALKLRKRAAAIFQQNNGSLNAISTDFLECYATLLHNLQFENEAARIDALLAQRQDTGKPEPQTAAQNDNGENNPEYWQRTELVPIAGVESFNNESLDHIQLWYDKGALRLEAFKAGELVWKNQFGECPTGILNAKADNDTLTVSWRDGDGPVWHNDEYTIGQNSIKLTSSSVSDAYADQINQQVEDVLNGDADAVKEGAVEAVPSTYINNNFISDTIRKGEHKALEIYGQGDAAAAAERLGMVFDLTAQAIDTRRSETNPTLSREEGWLDSFNFMGLPLPEYITALNDYGFFLQQSGNIKDSVRVLSLVVKASPYRTVAHLNLGDSYWKLGKRTEAQKCYKLYLALMKSYNQANIPARVLQRTSDRSRAISTKVPALKAQFLGV